MTTRLYWAKAADNVVADAGDGKDPAVFNASGVAVVASPDNLLYSHQAMLEPGLPGLYTYAETAAGETAEILTVPSGKAWRLVGLVHQQTNSSDVATRTVVVDVRDSADATIEALSSATSVADAETEYSFLWGADGLVVGNDGVAAAGTLTMDTQPTATDDFVLNATTFTFVALGGLTGAANEIALGSDLAATKLIMDLAFGATPGVGTHSVTDAVRTAIAMTAADFAGDDMVFTAVNQGTAGNSLATTETFTAGTNVFDAATLGTTTAGVDEANVISALDFPEDSGPLLTAGEDVEIIVTNGVAADDYKGYLFVIEYDVDPTSVTPTIT